MQVENTRNQVTDANLEVDDLESETIRLSSIEYVTLKKSEASFNKFARDIETYKSSFEQRESNRLRRERGFLEDEEEQLKITKEHVEVNVRHVEDERESTEKGIERQTKDQQLEQDRLSALDTKLAAEIEDLKRQLEEKLAEKERVSSDLSAVEEKIEAVRSKFKKQLDRVNKKQEKVIEERNANDQELETVRSKLKEIEDQENKVKDSVAKYIEQYEAAVALKSEVSATMSQLDKENKSKENVSAGMSASRELYYDKIQQLKALTDSLQSTETVLKRLDLDIESSEAVIKSLEDKIPQLEREKKTAAATRNFLEANKLSKEIKEKKEEIDAEAIKIEAMKSEREEVQNREPEKMKEVEQMRAKLTELKKDYEIWLYKRECQRLADLQRIIKSDTGIDREDIDSEYDWVLAKKNLLYEQYKDDIPVSEDEENKASDSELANDASKVQDEDGQSPGKSGQKDVPSEQDTENDQDDAKGGEIANEEAVNEKKTGVDEEPKVNIEELVLKKQEIETKLEELKVQYEKTEKDIEEASEVGNDDHRMNSMS
jgi:chromosome segregation ATPase